VYNHAGTVTISSAEFTRNARSTSHFFGVRTSNQNTVHAQLTYDDGLAPPDADVQITFHDDVPQGEDSPKTDAMQKMHKRLVQMSSSWLSKYPPLVQDLKDLSVPHYLNRYPDMPTSFFGIQKPAAFENEALFLRAVTIALNRRGEAVEDFMSSDTFASVIVAESLSAITNTQVYNADTEILPSRTKEIDEFSVDEREIHNGDCEDMSHEVCMLAYSLKHGTYTNAVVQRAQQIIQRYTVMLTFGEVSMDENDPNLDRYRAGKYFAHAFVILMNKLPQPTQSLQPVRIHDKASSLKNLAQDGIGLFDAQPFDANHRMVHWMSGLRAGDSRVRRMESIGINYYMYPFSAVIVDDDLLSSTYGTPIHEIGFVQEIEDGQLKRGCEFRKLIMGDPSVFYVPTCEMTPDQYASAQHCMRFFHPVTPYDTETPEPDLSLMESVLGIQRQDTITPGTKTCFFIQGPDAFDKKYLFSLKERMKNIETSYYVVDFFAQNVFTIEILS
jgi:hypothetical protein